MGSCHSSAHLRHSLSSASSKENCLKKTKKHRFRLRKKANKENTENLNVVPDIKKGENLFINKIDSSKHDRLPLIEQSKTKTTNLLPNNNNNTNNNFKLINKIVELEIYDNASLNTISFLNHENIIYVDENLSYPFPTLNLTDNSNSFECSCLTETTMSTSSACSTKNQPQQFQLQQQQLQQQQQNGVNNISKQSTSSVSSFNSVSSSSASSSTAPKTGLINRFGFKPTGSIPVPMLTTSVPIKSQTTHSTTYNQMATSLPIHTNNNNNNNPSNNNNLQFKKSAVGEENRNSEIVPSRSVEVQQPQQHQQRRNQSPFKSYLKPPIAATITSQPANQTSPTIKSSTNLINSSNNPSNTASSSTSSSSNQCKTGANATSSSLSSLSSNSSNASTCQQQKRDTNLPQQQQQTGLQQLKKSFLFSSKIQSQPSTITTTTTTTANSNQVKKSPSKPVVVSSASTTRTTSSPKSRATNLSKQPQNSSLTQHKPRLFAPYTLNINTNPNSNTSDINNNNNTNNTNPKPMSKLPAPPNQLQTSLDFHQIQSSKPPLIVNPSINATSNNGNNPHFKLYSQLNGFKLNLKPHKSNSIDENSLEKIKEFTNLTLTTQLQNTAPKHEADNSNNSTEMHNLERIDLLNENYSSSELKNGIKREDSAYCSSTSSTVSSQDVEITNHRCCSIPQSKSNYELRSESTSSNCTSNNECTAATANNNNQNNTELINTVDHDKQMNVKMRQDEEEMDEENDDLLDNLLASSNIASIKESFNELNQLKQQQQQFMMINSNISKDLLIDDLEDLNLNNKNCVSLRQRRTSLNSLSSNLSTSTSATANNNNNNSPMFKPPSKLPPCENSEIIQIDIETFRLIMQDIQNTKTILYRLANLLREPTSNTFNNSNNSDNLLDFQPDDLQKLINNNPLVSSFYSHHMNTSFIEKIEKSTQTDD